MDVWKYEIYFECWPQGLFYEKFRTAQMALVDLFLQPSHIAQM